MTPDGKVPNLYSFDGTNGYNPGSSLIEGPDGYFYGTTGGGGPNSVGTVFKFKPWVSYTVLYAFKGGADGAYPTGPLVMDPRGDLYGTTLEGGVKNQGVIFKISR